jgi:hypothetical protein
MPMTAMQASSATVRIRPLVPGGPMGSTTISSSSGTVHYHIVISGLMPGSAHAVHDHLGFCSGAGRSEHLRVLAVATADRSGTINIDTAVPAFDMGAGRIVIVYASSAPTLIIGCADL